MATNDSPQDDRPNNPPANRPADPESRQADQHNRHNKKSGTGSAIVMILCALLLLCLVVFGVVSRMRETHVLADEASTTRKSLPQVTFVKPTPSPNADLTLPGTTQAIADTVVAARTTGYISRRYVDIGDKVRAGQVLAEIAAPDVDASVRQAQQQTLQATAVVRQSQSDVANKQATVVQYQSNVTQTQANVEQARALEADSEAKLAQAVAQLSSTQALLVQFKQVVDIKRAALKQSQTLLDLASVTLKRYQTLLKSGYVALQDVDQSQANYDTAVAAVNSAEADLRGSQANVQSAEEQVRSANSNVSAFQAEVVAAQKNVNAVIATVNAAQATVRAAGANVRLSEATVAANRSAAAAALANAERFSVQRGFSRVIAPFAGVITARNVDVGTLINAGSGAGGSTAATSAGSSSDANSASTSSATPITTPGGGLFGLARTDILRVLVSVPETYAQQMHPGITVNLLIREFPSRTFAGAITNIAGAIDTVSRTLLVEVHVPNPNGPLVPGMYTQVHFNLPNTRGSLRLPSSALLYDAHGTRVATLSPDDKIHYVPIKVGRDFGTQIEVVEGLTGQERVVSNPSDDLVEGLKVQAKPAPPTTPSGQPGQPGNGQPGQPNGQGGAPANGGRGH
ncbi:MAG: family efflux transporter, subunit [Chthonomonadaceae bacterium]|nr:family efflux transporter, subunit [Chthonomonadaceae bacterium]